MKNEKIVLKRSFFTLSFKNGRFQKRSFLFKKKDSFQEKRFALLIHKRKKINNNLYSFFKVKNEWFVFMNNDLYSLTVSVQNHIFPA